MKPHELTQLAVALDPLWADQQAFDAHFRDVAGMGPEDRQHSTYELCMRAVMELAELAEAVAWKPHRARTGQPSRQLVLGEVVDTFKYVLALCNVWGIRPEDFVQALDGKQRTLWQRWREVFGNPYNAATHPRGIVGVDLDGVLADYVGAFTAWVAAATGVHVEPEAVTTPDVYASYLRYFTTDRIEALKQQFREEGQLRTLPLYAYAKGFMDYCRTAGLYIVAISSRPAKRHPRVWPDTLQWLEANLLPYDALVWEHEKALWFAPRHEHVVMVVEDDPRQVAAIAALGVPVAMPLRSYNSKWQLPDDVRRCVYPLPTEEWAVTLSALVGLLDKCLEGRPQRVQV